MLLFFIASGMTGLVLEVTWTRILGVVFGNTVYAASTVLTVFMLGMAAGSTLLGRIADKSERPLYIYGLLEIGLGFYALVFPLLANFSLVAYQWFFRTAHPDFALLNAARFLISMLLLLPPTILMGGTLPVLSRHLARDNDQPGKDIGYLYGANTAGAVLGCFIAGFVLLKSIGVNNSLYLAGAVAISTGCFAVFLGYRHQTVLKPKKTVTTKPAPRLDPLDNRLLLLVLIAFGITGFCSMAYEVLWMRIMIFVLTTATYSFPTMLTTFLCGLAIGSLISSRFIVAKIRRPLLWFGFIELTLGFSVLLSIPLLSWMEQIDFVISSYITTPGPSRIIITRFLDAVVIMIIPTILMGMAFPIVIKGCLGGSKDIGKRTGQAYAFNTIGCVLGSFFAGFVFLPIMGTHKALLLVIAINFLAGIALVWYELKKHFILRLGIALPVTACIFIAFMITPYDIFYRTINTYHNPSEILFLKEHPTGTVTVHKLPTEETLISSCGVNVAGVDYMLRTTQKLQGYIPLLLHPDPQKVAQIGFGSGETTRVGLEYGVGEYTIVEICPAIFDAGCHFEEINHGSYKDPRLKKVIMDGKNFALLSNEKFDIVMNDSVYPGSGGGSSLYTYDHFYNCRQRLKPGGLFSCWVPIDLRPGELNMILKSFQKAFEHTTFWIATNCLNKHALILGSLEPLEIDFTRLNEAISRKNVADDLKEIDIDNVYDLLDCLICDENSIREMTKDSPINTDNHPYLEYSCAIPVANEASLSYIFSMLAKHHAPVERYVKNFINENKDRIELKKRFNATRHIIQGQAAQIFGDAAIRSRQYMLALKANPGENHVNSCQAELQKEISDLRVVIKLSQNSVFAKRLADKLYMNGRFIIDTTDAACPDYTEARNIYIALIDKYPSRYPDAYIKLSNIFFRSGEVNQAESILRQCICFWPRYAEAHDRLAGLYLRTNRKQLALEHIQEAIRLAPQNDVFKLHLESILGTTN